MDEPERIALAIENLILAYLLGEGGGDPSGYRRDKASADLVAVLRGADQERAALRTEIAEAVHEYASGLRELAEGEQ
jgi:hypothetical protein